MSMTQVCDDFLRKYGMHHETIDLKKEANVFQTEMAKGLASTDSSLMMLPTYLSVADQVPYDTPIVIIDAGGTNFRVAVVTLRQGQDPLVEDFQVSPMPGTQGTIGKQEFFDTIAERLLPIIHRSDKVGFCYSYPSRILPNKDGMYLGFSKEVSVEGMDGVVLGEEINQSLAKHGIPPKEFLVLNDTVAVLLAGIGEESIQEVDGYVGLVYGTGGNTAYIEDTVRITKDKDAMAQGGAMVINMELGGYDKFPRGQLDLLYDSRTINPGFYVYEKMMSGAYLGGIMHTVIGQAVTDGLFTDFFRAHFPMENEQVPLWEVSAFLEQPAGENAMASWCETEGDRELLLCLCRRGYERAAKLIAIGLAGILLHTGKGKDPNCPACIVAEGTTFEKSPVFRRELDRVVDAFFNQELGIYCRFDKVEDATLRGTAVAGLIG